MSRRLNGQVAIVTGSAKGIGAAIVRRFIAAGASVVFGDIDEKAGQRLAAELGSNAVFEPADITNEEAMHRLADTALSRFARLDILAQNAGIYPSTLLKDLPLSQWQQVMTVNLTGTFLAMRACLPAMQASGRGRMIFTSSITGPRVANFGVGAYAATKAGINGLIRSAALEFAASGITVNGVEPGNIITEGLMAGRTPEFIEKMKKSIPLGRLGTPEDVANAVLFLASDEAAYITGTTIIVDGGQILPEGGSFADAWQ